MEYSSLPSYPPPLPPRSAVARPRRGRRLGPRQARVLVDLAWVTGIVALLVWARQTADAFRRPPPPPPEPLPFKVVAERFKHISILMPAEELFAQLGPERYAEFREPEMDEYDRLVECHPERYPRGTGPSGSTPTTRHGGSRCSSVAIASTTSSSEACSSSGFSRRRIRWRVV